MSNDSSLNNSILMSHSIKRFRQIYNTVPVNYTLSMFLRTLTLKRAVTRFRFRL